MSRGDGKRQSAPAGHLPALHLPVLYTQVMEGLQVKEDGTYLDGTFGRGGHARGVLQRLGPGGRLLLMDKDPDAIAHAEQMFAGDARVAIRRGSFASMAQWDKAAAGLDGVLLDLNLPDQPGFVALESFREKYASTPVVVVSAQEDRATVLKALELGAKAFVPKSADSARLHGAIEALLDGRISLPESITGNDAFPAPASNAPCEWALTERQKEVLALILMGLPNKLIARRLNIVESTVKIHVSAILRELKVASRTQALIAVAKYGIKLPMPLPEASSDPAPVPAPTHAAGSSHSPACS